MIRQAVLLHTILLILLSFRVNGSAVTASWPGYGRHGASSVVVTNNYAFVGLYAAGILVIDISNSSSPNIVGGFGSYQGSMGVTDLKLRGNLLFYTDFLFGLRILNVSDPRHPFQVGEFPLPFSSAWGLSIDGDVVSVGVRGGVRLLDISNPEKPEEIGIWQTNDGITLSPYAIVQSGSMLFVAGQFLYIIDISNPREPKQIRRYPASGLGVAALGSFVYVADPVQGLLTLDVSDPLNPALRSTYKPAGQCRGVGIKGNHLFVINHEVGVDIMDLADPAEPKWISGIDLPGEAHQIDFWDNAAYVASWIAGLQVLNIQNLANPTLMGSCKTAMFARDVGAFANKTFLADGIGGLVVFDRTNPFNLRKIGTFPVSQEASKVAVNGGVAVLAENGVGVHVLDVSGDGDPVLYGTVRAIPNARDFVFRDSLVYTCSGFGLHLLDISNPSTPIEISRLGTSPGNAIDVMNDVAFVSTDFNGLQIIDCANRAQPKKIGELTVFPIGQEKISTTGVKIAGHLAYVSCGSPWWGLLVLDVSDPAQPSFVGFHSMGTPIYVEGDLAFVLRPSEIRIYDISDPMVASFVDSIKVNLVEKIVRTGDILSLSGGTFGLKILSLSAREPVIQLTREANQSMLNLNGQVGRSYVIEEAFKLPQNEPWTNRAFVTLTNSNQMQIPVEPLTSSSNRFFRARIVE